MSDLTQKILQTRPQINKTINGWAVIVDGQPLTLDGYSTLRELLVAIGHTNNQARRQAVQIIEGVADWAVLDEVDK